MTDVSGKDGYPTTGIKACPRCGMAYRSEHVIYDVSYYCGSQYRKDRGDWVHIPACDEIAALRAQLAEAQEAAKYASDTGVRDRLARREAERKLAEAVEQNRVLTARCDEVTG